MKYRKIPFFIGIFALLFLFSSCRFPFPPESTTYETTGEIKTENISDIQVTDLDYDFLNAKQDPITAGIPFFIPNPIPQNAEYRGLYNTGTNRILEGKQTVVLFFMDDNRSSWDAETIEAFTKANVLPALEFIEEEATKWDVAVDFNVWRYSSALSEELTLTYDGTILRNTNEEGFIEDMMEKTAKIFGYPEEMPFYQFLLKKTASDGIIPIFLVNENGRSYALPSRTFGYETMLCEKALVFSSYNNVGFHEQAPTFAHEILHLFGAEDLYEPEERRELAEVRCPQDIMRKTTQGLRGISIGEFTAYTLGWTNTIPTVCYEEGW